MVSHQPLSVKNKVAIRAFNCWYFGNYVLSFFFFFIIAVFHLITNRNSSWKNLKLLQSTPSIRVTSSVFTCLDRSMISGVESLLGAILSDC